MEGKELTIIENSIEVFKSGAGILIANRTRAEKAMQVGASIVQAWEEVNRIEDADERAKKSSELDERSKKFLINCGAAKDEMMESRKAITQLMDAIRAAFTEEENKLDNKKSPIPVKVQQYRNDYATWWVKEQEERKRAAEKKAEKDRERAELFAKMKQWLSDYNLTRIKEKKEAILNTFNGITLDSYEEKSNGLIKMTTEAKRVPLAEIKIVLPTAYHHTLDEVQAIALEVKEAYDFEAYYKDFSMQISLLKHDLVGKLESKRAELEEHDRLRREAEEAEKKRQEELAKVKDQQEKERLQMEQERARKEEEERLRRAEQDRLQREQDEREKIEAEQARAAKEAELKIEAEREAAKAAALFDQAVGSAEIGSTPAVKKSFVITVLHPAGWVELFSYWYGKEGVKTALPELEKKTLKQIKAFCEKAAKEGERIESKFLRYDEDIKAINKKEKAA